ncbi:MAG: hypothetical protein EOP67_36560 [Sphingomonas sp.]|nr:MAG: hypothetical protein EOP67_36560 [Sphingomonas sp.]
MIPFLFAAVAAAASPQPAAAATSPLALTTTMLAETRVPAADGSVTMKLAAPNHVGPGDRVVVQLAYRNRGTAPIAGLVLANPVPTGLAYRGPRGAGAAPEVSVDGRTFGPLSTLRVPAVAGGTRPATADDVTHVRWRLNSPVTAGTGGELAFQAIVR